MASGPIHSRPGTPPRAGHRLERSPGEVAFDRCVFPFGLLLVLGSCALGLAWFADPMLRFSVVQDPKLSFLLWLPRLIAVAFYIHWMWAFAQVLRTWHDPRARVLRFSSLGVLGFQGLLLWLLLRAPSLFES